MKIKTFCFLLLAVLASGKLDAQKTSASSLKDSLITCISYEVWFDTGVYPFRGIHEGNFEPTFNMRLGIGKQFNIFQLFGFLEFDKYEFDAADVLSPPFKSSDMRYDIDLYAMGSVLQVISLGIGVYYTHQDNIIGRDRSGTIITESGVYSYLGLYYLVGLGYRVKISDAVSLPIGLYYCRTRNYRYSDHDNQIYSLLFSNTSSLRVGIVYDLSQ